MLNKIVAILITLSIYFFATVSFASTDETQGDAVVQNVSEAPKSLEDYCKTAPCRKNLILKLKKKDGTYFEYKSELEPPVVQPAFISIYAGETIFIEANEGKERPTDINHVPENKHPERTIVFKFTQPEDMGKGHGMLLTVHNPFPKPLRYNLGIMPLSEENLYKTSSCPVIAGGKVFEQWPYPIFLAVVSNMHFLNDGDNMSCRK